MKRFALFLLASLVTAACGTDPRTEILLAVYAPERVASETSRVVVTFYDVMGQTLETQTVQSPTWPLTYALIRDRQAEFVGVVEALDASDATVATEVFRVTFARGETKLYRIDLRRLPEACERTMCPFATRCTVSSGTASCAEVPTTDGAMLPDLPADPTAPDALDPCVGVTCGPRQECRFTNGLPGCGCEFPWTGAACDACGTGWVVENGTCVGACRGTCGLHEVCDETVDVPECACVRGYEKVAMGCTWIGGGANGGGIRDEHLANASEWSIVQTSFSPTLFGAADGGATMNNFAACGEASLGQTVQMPDRADAEPFALEVTVRSNDVNFAGDTLVQARIGSSLLPLSFSGGATRIGTTCLGANAYGRDVDFALIPDAMSNRNVCVDGANGNVRPPVTIDRIRIVPSSGAVCPSPGIRNGDFSLATDWTFALSSNGQAGSSGLSAGAALLSLTKFCQSASMRQNVAFPTSAEMPNPALRFLVNGTLNDALRVVVDSGSSGDGPITLASAVGTGGSGMATICVPPWLQGTTRQLHFRLADASGLCSTDFVRNFTIDDMSFASDPSCAGATSTFDGTFERGSYSTGFEIPLFSSYGTRPLMGAITDLGNAHSGSGLFRVDDLNSVATVAATAWLRVPIASGTMRPQIRYWYKTNIELSMPTVSIAGGSPVPGTTTWTEHVHCVDPGLGGQLVPFQFTFSRALVGQTIHYLDDVTITLGPGC